MNLTLYSVYSYPNTVLAFFGGYIIDRLTGVRLGAMIFCGLILLGQCTFAAGITIRQYWLAVVGRLIFGLGGESLTVAQNTYTQRWFDGKILALAFGLVVSFSRIGSSVNFLVTPTLAEADNGVTLSLWVGSAMCGLSFCFVLVAAFLDRRYERFVKKTDEEEAPKLSHIKEIPLPAWILYLICTMFYVGVLTFYTVASKIMQETGHKYSPKDATFFLAIPNFVSIVMSPLFGALVDKVGRALYFIMFASTMMICAHVAFLGNANEWWEIHPAFVFGWLGIGYSMGAASIWPILSHIAPLKILGTAYGCMTAMQNAGMAIFPQIIGVLQDSSAIKAHGLVYTLPLMIFVGAEIVSFSLAVLLLGLDKKFTKGRLNASHAERKAREDLDAKQEALIDPY